MLKNALTVNKKLWTNSSSFQGFHSFTLQFSRFCLEVFAVFSLFAGFHRPKIVGVLWLVDRSSNFFDLLPSFKVGKWLNWSPRCFDSIHILPEFLNTIAAFPLIYSSYA